MLEARYDFSQVENELEDQDRTAVQLWQTNTQKEELEFVAKSIRQRLHDGARYRDIRVLLGDVEAYQLQLKTIFDQSDPLLLWDEVKPWSTIPLDSGH